MSQGTWAQRWRRSEPMRRRLSLGAAVGAAGGLVLALLDASWLRGATTEPPALGDAWLADAGIVIPLTLLVGLVVGFLSWFVHPRAEPSVSGILCRLRETSHGRVADMAAFVPLTIIGLFLWTTLSAQIARAVLAAEAPPLTVGAAIATAAVVSGALIALIVLAVTPWLRHKLAAIEARRAVDPATTGGVALLVVAALVGYGVTVGTVSGAGGFFGIYGIFKRQELDLRLPAMLLALVLAIYLAPPLLRRIKPYQAALVALAPLLITARAAAALNADTDLARQIERHAPLAARSLGILRKLTDRDGDGASAYFGGGDCDDASSAIGPAADDIPDNGIDEDCSGDDLSLAGIASAEPVVPKPVTALDRLPKDGNVVLITIDTLRYDLGYTGYKRPVSPNIDKLAADSIIYETAYALASYTGKSVGPMLIGKYGSETHRNWGHFNKFGPEDTFVAERLQRAGIHTIAVHGHRYFGEFGGLERGFDVLDMSAAPDKGAKWATDTTVTSATLTDAAIAAIDSVPAGKPYFAWVHYLDPHADYKKHAEVPDFGNSARALYDNEVAFTDLHIGRLLDRIKGDKTSIIITSDHGEAFNDNGMWRHGVEVWEVLVRVPLVVHVPGVPAKRIAARRSLIDLVPTLLDLMQLGKPAGGKEGDDFLSGVSWVDDWFGEPPVRDILVDMPAGPYNRARRAFIRGDLKLIISGGAQKELFDLKDDPGEVKNLWKTRRKDIEAYYAAAKAKLKEIVVTGKFK